MHHTHFIHIDQHLSICDQRFPQQDKFAHRKPSEHVFAIALFVLQLHLVEFVDGSARVARRDDR